jgi:hypothetical protein
MELVDDILSLYEKHGYYRDRLADGTMRPGVLHLLEQGRILWHYEGKDLAVYLESWRLDYEQWGRKVCRERVNIFEEDIATGPVCYVADVIIHPSHRRRDVFRVVRDLFFNQNNDATFFVGLALRKKTQPIKVFRARDIGQSRFLSGMMEVNSNGR